MSGDDFEPVTPGEILKEEFLKGYALSQNQLARAIGISRTASPKSSTTGAASQPIPR